MSAKYSFSERLNHFLFKYFKPVMVGGFRRSDGVFLKRTRIGNTVTLIGKENFKVADNVYIGHYNFIDASNGLEIGKGCQVTNHVSILTHSSHISIRLYGDHYRESGNKVAYGEGMVAIGQYTFVGPHTVIMPGTTVGKGSLIKAYSLLKGDYPDFSIIGGNPATVQGDTREMDAEYLQKNPDLKQYYDEWAK